LSIDGTDVNNTPKTTIGHSVDHLFGHVKQTIEVGIHHGAPVIGRHFTKYAIAGDTCIIDQHIDRAMLCHNFFKCSFTRVPVRHIANRCIKSVAQGGLFIDPLLMVATRTTSSDHCHPILGQTLTNRSADAAHTTRDVRNLCTHVYLLVVLHLG
jgi:hypothetical protein